MQKFQHFEISDEYDEKTPSWILEKFFFYKT
jgi:hypothetical protein